MSLPHGIQGWQFHELRVHGFETITPTTSTGLTASKTNGFQGARMAVVNVEAADIRYRPDGATNAPSATVGMLTPNGSNIIVTGHDQMVNIRFIDSAGASTLSVSYYK